jgi:threonylcarbamoyladenosine tRNA methylthiotransferase MtaB
MSQSIPHSFHVENFGCRATRADSEAIATSLRAAGMSESGAASSVIVVNTCSVTAEADKSARAYLRRAHREYPNAKILVTGCYAQRAPDELAALPGVAAVIGNSHKAFVPEIALGLLQPASNLLPVAALFSGKVLVGDDFAHSELASPDLKPGEQTRPNLKVQDGCSNRCSFCIIPTTRGGNSRSLPIEETLSRVRSFSQQGGLELVMSGINLGRYGRDLADTPTTLAGLVRKILAETPLFRLRISSVEPMDWDEDLFELLDAYAHGPQPRLARHAHLPLQSGSDRTLRAMHRRYRPWHYADKLSRLRSLLPDAAIGADVMVGFPGETDVDFRESYDFIAAQPFTYLHLFPFSPRPATRAWELHRQRPVSPQAVAERLNALRELIQGRHRQFVATQMGRVLPAISLHGGKALTDNFLEAAIAPETPANLAGSLQLLPGSGTGPTRELAGEFQTETIPA